MRKTKKENFSIEKLILDEYKEALAEYKRYNEVFNYAEGEYVNIAIDFLKATELKLDAVRKKAKFFNIKAKEIACDMPIEM